MSKKQLVWPKTKFVNRKQEIDYISKHLNSDVQNIFWIYGPKSTGKTTLITKVLETLDPKEYLVCMTNVRRVRLENARSFINSFFRSTKTDEKFSDVVSGIHINTWIF